MGLKRRALHAIGRTGVWVRTSTVIPLPGCNCADAGTRWQRS